MAEVQIRDILVGYGDLYYADYDDVGGSVDGTGDPDFDYGDTFFTGGPTAGLRKAFDDSADWTYAGATQEGVELGYAPEYGEVEVDQLGDAAVMFFQTAQVTLNTQLAEATLGNLLVAWGFDSESLTTAGNVDTFKVGIPGQTPIERSVAVVGKGASGTAGGARDRVYIGWRALSIEGSSLAMRRNENTSYQVSFRLLADPKHVGEEYGVIIDRIPAGA